MSEHQTWTFAYPLTTQDITGCNADIQNFLLEYAVAPSYINICRVSQPCKLSQLYDRAVIKRQNDEIRSQVAQILLQHEKISSNLVSIHGCATLIDAAGHEYEVPLKFCTSIEVSIAQSDPFIKLNRCHMLTGPFSNFSICF
jgi:hypothetical protein